MTTKEKKYFDSIQDVDIEENLTKEELKRLEINTANAISRQRCSDNNIDVSLIALDELKSIGFKSDMSTMVFSKLIEDLYHERTVYDESDYFNLVDYNNDHYSRLEDNIGIKEEFCRAMIAFSIDKSDCETKNVNDIVYTVVGRISKKINNSKNNNIKFRLEA